MTCKELVEYIQDNKLEDFEMYILGYTEQKVKTVEFSYLPEPGEHIRNMKGVQEKLRKANKLYLSCERNKR